MPGTRTCSVFAVLAAVVLSAGGAAATPTAVTPTAASTILPKPTRPMMGCCFVAF